MGRSKIIVPLQKENKLELTTIKGKETTKHQWVTEINYKGHILNWIKTEEINKKYVFVTSLKITKKQLLK